MKTKKLLDANILIRIITRDDIVLYKKSLKIMENINDGLFLGIITPLILSEIVYVLSSKRLYNMSRKNIVSSLFLLFETDNILLEEKIVIINTLMIFESNGLDFVDCYLLAKKQTGRYDEILTFDKKLQNVLS